MNTEEMIKSLATSVMTFVDQTKDNLLEIQEEIRDLKTTVGTMADEMKADREAQKKAAADASKKINKAVVGIGKEVAAAVASDAVEATVTSASHLRPKEPPNFESPTSVRVMLVGNIRRCSPSSSGTRT